LADDEPDRQIIQAVPKATYDEFLSKPQTAAYLRRYDVKLLVYNSSSTTIDKWQMDRIADFRRVITTYFHELSHIPFSPSVKLRHLAVADEK
jgi:hypothetical protein